MAIPIIRGYQIIPEGDYVARITKLKLEPNTSGDGKADILHVHFKISSGSNITKRVYLVMEEGTELGEIVMAVNNGTIPNKINDLEKFLIGKVVEIEVVHNTSRKTGRIYANVARVYSIDNKEDEEDSDEFVEDEEFEEDTEEDIEEEMEDDTELELEEVDDEDLEIEEMDLELDEEVVDEDLSFDEDDNVQDSIGKFPQNGMKKRRKRAI